ncbi:MAG: hypothetical protein IKS85_08795 [Lachnospiraceae bacterium]|nr:hypothetical protein [Lachnospiraceae bacterium]
MTEDDIRGAFAEMLKERQGKTDAATEKLEAMSEEALEKVGGGVDCNDTFQSGENCWVNDACDLYLYHYSTSGCQNNFLGNNCEFEQWGNCESAVF